MDTTTDYRTRPVTLTKQRAVLEVVEGGSRGSRFTMGDRPLVAGRGDTQIRLNDSGVSRCHAKFVPTLGGGVMVLDLSSKNGTVVNNAEVEAAVLRAGDRVRLGPHAVVRLCYVSERDGQTSVETTNELSERQTEVASLVADGLTNAEIADALAISTSTVASHLDNIFKRLGFRSRTALARWVVESRGPGVG